MADLIIEQKRQGMSATLIDKVLSALAKAPPGLHAQIDETQTVRLKELIGKAPGEQSRGLKAILDDCAAYGLASDFAMTAMHLLWATAEEANRKEME